MSDWVKHLQRRARALFRSDVLDDELREEIQLHVELEAEDLMHTQGLSRDEARRRAMLSFGGVSRYREAQRDARGVQWLEQLAQDVKYAIRSLRKSPGFVVTTVLTIALGIGATTTVYSVVDGLIFHPLPFANGSRVVLLDQTESGKSAGGWLRSPDVLAWEREAKSFDAISLMAYVRHGLSRGTTPVGAAGVLVSPRLFRALGVEPIVGRLFTQADTLAGAPNVVLLSEGVWKRDFGGASDVVGTRLTSGDTAYTVVGVVPDALVALCGYVPTDFWEPVTAAERQVLTTRVMGVRAAAVLRPGVTTARAQEELTVLLRASLHNARNVPTDGYPEVHLVQPVAFLNATFRSGIAVAFAATLLVLLIACANVANLQLVRASQRREEVAVRATLGASRARLVRQLLVESLLLAAFGGAAGVVLGWAGTTAMVRGRPQLLRELAVVHLDRRVVLFAVGATLLTSVIYGVVPVLRTTRVRLADALRSVPQVGHSRARNHLQSGVVVAEMALTFVLLIGAGLPARSFLKMLALDPGFRPDGLLELSTALPHAKYPDSTSQAAYWARLVARARAVPGVIDVVPATVGMSQAAMGFGSFRFETDQGVHAARPINATVSQRNVSADYFRVMGIRVLAGRVFTPEEERGETDAMIVDSSFAVAMWPGESAIGKRFRPYAQGASLPWNRVVGVVSDVGLVGLQQYVQAMQEYTPARADHIGAIRGILVRVRPGTNESAALSALKGAFTGVDAEVHAGLAINESEFLTRSLGVPRFVTWLLVVFGGLAIALAAIGLYGVVAHTVAQRTHEIGVRIAMGAGRGDIARLVLIGGVRLSIAGIGIGLAAALGTTRLVASLLFRVSPTDPGVFGGVALGLLLMALAACYLPARCAARVDPVIALKAE